MTARVERDAAEVRLKRVRADLAAARVELKQVARLRAEHREREAERYREAVQRGEDFTPEPDSAPDAMELSRRITLLEEMEREGLAGLQSAAGEAAKELGLELRPDAVKATQQIADALGPLFEAVRRLQELIERQHEVERLGGEAQLLTAKFDVGLGLHTQPVVPFDFGAIVGWCAEAYQAGVTLPEAILADSDNRAEFRARGVSLPESKRRRKTA